MPRASAENTSRFPMQMPPPEKAERIDLNEEQTRFILDLLDNPPKPNAKLEAAARSLAGRSDSAELARGTHVVKRAGAPTL